MQSRVTFWSMVLTATTRQRLRTLRLAQDPPLSQYAVAQRVGMGRHRYWTLEKGYAWPTAQECDRLAAFHNQTRARLFPEVEARLALRANGRP